MRNVIKTSQYDGMQPYVATEESMLSPAAATAAPPENKLKEAFVKAKQIVDAANAYGDNYVREVTERMNRESQQTLERSREEGFESGRIEGERVGQEQGYAAGYEEGYQKSMQETTEANRALLENVCAVVEQLKSAKELLLDRTMEDMSELAFEIARTVIGREIMLPETALQSMLEHSLEQYREQEWLRIYLSPKMAELLNQPENNLKARLGEVSRSIKIIANQDLEDSDCLAELPEGAVDLSVSTQMEKIKSVIKW